MGTRENVYVGGVLTVTIGTAGAAADQNVGFTQDGAEISYSVETVQIEVDQSEDILDEIETRKSGEVTLNFAEHTLALMQTALGGTIDGNQLTLDSERTMISLQIADANGFTHYFPNVKAKGDVKMKYTKQDVRLIPVTFGLYKLGTEPVVITGPAS